MSSIGGPGGVGPKGPPGLDGPRDIAGAEVADAHEIPGATHVGGGTFVVGNAPIGGAAQIGGAPGIAGVAGGAAVAQVPGLGAPGVLEAIAGEVAAGRLSRHEAFDLLIDDAVGDAAGALDAAERDELRALLDELVANDPHLGALRGRL